jgi:hypothetical protein
MLTLSQTVAMVLGAFAPLFSKRIFEHVKLLVVGAILAPGKRTVTSVLRVVGNGDDWHFQNYHRMLNRVRWLTLLGHNLLSYRDTPRRRPSSPKMTMTHDVLTRFAQ